ncbi:trypsin Inhibitor like cysteine rich domain protein [Oesophagostomum dentatum]|uniref:Trypsin Inhibitor like cysteine rich domain protein n=1 Tax=Oesophagostomum dentatum TaxID=61180 RepID=A0A0B1RUM1_OESDE|nr:trypsin Inhibitor like cysteine rich domain protein [Oesophagostomum dentatum]
MCGWAPLRGYPTGITCAPDPVCPQNEIFNICASNCEQTCVPMGRPCSINCLPPKCQCQPGFVRENGKCIDPKDCPNRRGSTTTTPSYEMKCNTKMQNKIPESFQ